MCRTLVSQLICHERIETTLPRAKELRRLADKMVTLGKEVCLQNFDGMVSLHTVFWEKYQALMIIPHLQNTLSSRRKAAEVLRGDGVMHKLFTEFAERYKAREGGYTRILQTRRRPNDCAQMAFIE